MKKILLSVFLAAALGASEYNYEISPMVGEASSNNRQELQDHTVYAVEAQYNGLESAIKPELSIFYSNADYNNGRGDTNIFRTAINGVYEFQKSNLITPFVKMGVGYETMSNHQYDNHNSAFADAGAGVKIALTEQIALKLEAIDMLKFNDFNWDNNLLLLAGLNFAFGEKAQPSAPAPKPVPVTVVAAPLDSDGDGVIDELDKCPETPKGFKVDKDGCPTTFLFKVLFDFDSSKIKTEFTGTIEEFAVFMKENAYVAEIQGHACNIGTDEYNQKLSERRADAVMKKLIELGIDSKRLKAVGYGESKPLNSNSTLEERQQNRRVEGELSR